MTGQDRVAPSRTYVRRDPGVDPPSLAFTLKLEREMAEGDVALFVNAEAKPSLAFELHRVGGAFRVCDLVTEPRFTFASAGAAIRTGWAAIDAEEVRAAEGLPSLETLLRKPSKSGGRA